MKPIILISTALLILGIAGSAEAQRNATDDALHRLPSSGVWVSPTLTPADFMGSGAMRWTAADSVYTFEYELTGKKLTINFLIQGSTVGGSPNAVLSFRIPGGFAAAKQFSAPYCIVSNGKPGIGFVQILPGATTVDLLTPTFANWELGTASVYGSVTFEIQ